MSKCDLGARLDLLSASYPLLFTPFHDGKGDFATHRKLMEFQVQNDTFGMLFSGTKSEPSTLTIAGAMRSSNAQSKGTA